MNWKVLLAGAGTIVIIFLGYVGWQSLLNRQRLAEKKADRPVSQVTVFPNGQVPSQAAEIMRSEIYAQTALVRGEITQYDQANHVATMAVETRQLNGTFAVIGLLELVIDPNTVKDFLCWPSVFKTQTGQDISIRYAYMPINQNSVLKINGEISRPLNQLPQYLTTHPLAFALLTSSPTDAQSLLEDVSGLPPQVVKQMAILGCNE